MALLFAILHHSGVRRTWDQISAPPRLLTSCVAKGIFTFLLYKVRIIIVSGSSVRATRPRPGAAAPSMVDQPDAVVQEDPWMSTQALDRLLKMPLPLPRIRTRPWWFPALELRDPLVFYLEACLADPIFGKNGAMIPEIEWMNQVLLTVEKVNSGSLIEITVFGQPRVQNRVRSVLLSLAARHRENRARDKKIKQLEKFLKAYGSPPPTPQSAGSRSPVA